MIDTKQRILDAAERLFSEKGYDATSLRHIITEAGVNLAAIHYHFGSKEELMDELIQRGVGPVNQKRLQILNQVEAEAGEGPLAVEKVLGAFLLPVSEMADRNPQFGRLMGRMHAEGMMPTILQRHFQQIIVRFRAAMHRALPELPEQEFLWRIHFMMGAMAHTMCGTPDFKQCPAARSDFESRIVRLMAFLSGGFRAPVPQFERIEVGK